MTTPRAWKQEAADLRKMVEKERGAAEAATAEAASLREALDGERRAVKALRRDLERQLKAVREAEANKTADLLQQLRNKLTLELSEAVENEKEAAVKSTTAELQRLHQAHESELRKDFSRKEEDLRKQLRDALAHSRHQDAASASADTLQTTAKQGTAAPSPPEILALRALNKRLETRVQELEEAERRNADKVRSQYEEHAMREAEQKKMTRRETHLLLEKLKSRDRSIEHLEKEITTLKGRLDETRHVRDRFDSEKPGESPRLGIKRTNTRNSGLPPEAMRARSSRMKDNNSNELNDEQPSCKNSKSLIPKAEINESKDDKKDFKSNTSDDEVIRQTTDIDEKEDKEIQTDTNEELCIYKESSTNTDEEGLDSWTRAVGLETLYQVVVREHQDLQRAHQALLAKFKAEQRARLDLEAPIKIREQNPINLALAAQIEELTAKQEELISENHDLREQNDLLEFRLLEMDSAPASLHFKTAPASPSRSPESRGGGDREVDDVSDSGVLSLPTSEDISEADFHDLAMEPSSRDIKFKLAQLCLSIENVTDKVSIQQGLSLLRHYEVRLETALNTLSQDSLSVRSLTSPDSVISSETSKSQSRIIATVLPFTDLSQSCSKQKDEAPLKKLFKDADCLQESGIFEESPEYCSRCTQTDCSSSSKLETTGDLSLEIRKLKQIQERIEEQGSNKRLLRANVNEANGLSTESKELTFYRDRVEMLENKLAIYESSGDEQIKKMNLRLDREILLSAEIKHLKERCRMLEELNRKLEEEKCEFEEAENDTRLRCQKLEVKLSALGEKKSDLQVQLQQNARTMSNLRSCLAEEERKRIEARQHASRMENLVQHYEQRNFELEEKEIESRCRAQMLEKTIPALQIYNTWKVTNAICKSAGANESPRCNNSKMITSHSEVDVSCDGGDDRAKFNHNHKRHSVRNSLVPSFEREIGDQCTNQQESSSTDEGDCIDQDNVYEDYLHDRIKQLELAIKCKEELQQQSLSPDQKNSLISKIQDLKKTNCDLECRLKDLEMKEGYYKQTLQQADEMWANMEGGYKEQLRELENKLDDKQNEIYEFEAIVRKLSCEKEMRHQLQERTCSLESEMKDYRFKIAEKECERKLLEKERLRLTEELEHTNEEFNYLKHVIEPSLRQQLEEHKKMTKELKREIESLEKDREQEIEDRLAEKLTKHYQTDSSVTESDEPFITPPQTPERKKRSDSHGRISHKEHNAHKKHSKSSSSSLDSYQILICDECLLRKKFILACISCGRTIEEGTEGFSSFRASSSTIDLNESTSHTARSMKKGNSESKVTNGNFENGSAKVLPKYCHGVAPKRNQSYDGSYGTDRLSKENQDVERKIDIDGKSHGNNEMNGSNHQLITNLVEEEGDSQTKVKNGINDNKDDNDSNSKEKNENNDKDVEGDDNRPNNNDKNDKNDNNNNNDDDDDDDDDDNDDDKGDSKSKDPSNRNSGSKDKRQNDDDNGKDGNRRNSYQGNNEGRGSENAEGNDGTNHNQSESHSNRAGKSVDESDKNNDEVKENLATSREEENPEEPEGSSQRIEMDLETFYVFMNPAMMSNHFFKTPVPDTIPIYKPRYYDSTLFRETDLFDGGATSWNTSLPYPPFRQQLLKRILDDHNLNTSDIGRKYNMNEKPTSSTSLFQERKPSNYKNTQYDIYHLSNHKIKIPSDSKLNKDNQGEVFFYNQENPRLSSVPFENIKKSGDCVEPNRTSTKVTSRKLIELLINEDFRSQNRNLNNGSLGNKEFEKHCSGRKEKFNIKDNDTSFKDSLLSLLAFDNNIPKPGSQNGDSKIHEKRSNDKRNHETPEIERKSSQEIHDSTYEAQTTEEFIKKSKIGDKVLGLNLEEIKKMESHYSELDVRNATSKTIIDNGEMETQSCLKSKFENIKELKILDCCQVELSEKEELHESAKERVGENSPSPSSNSLLESLTDMMDGIYLKLFNEILIRTFENSSISLESHVVILKLYKTSLSSILNDVNDREKILKNSVDIENAFSEILKCFVTSKSVEVVENILSRFLLQLRRPHQSECDMYSQKLNPITFVANYMESMEIIVVGLVARQITRLLKSISVGKIDNVLVSFLNQLNLLKPLLGINVAKNSESDAVVEEIQEIVLFFLEGICGSSNRQDALELVKNHLAIIENIKLVKTKQKDWNYSRQFLSENKSSICVLYSNVDKHSENEKINVENLLKFHYDDITSNESGNFKNSSNSMFDFKVLRSALGLTLKHVDNETTANKLKKYVSCYKDICEKLLCENSTKNLELKPSVLEFENEVKYILKFVNNQFQNIVQNIDCKISRACLLVDLEYIFDDHIRILNFLETEIRVTSNNEQEEGIPTCIISEEELDSTTVQNNGRLDYPLPEKEGKISLDSMKKKSSSRHEGGINPKPHKSKQFLSTKHTVSNNFSRPGGVESKLINDSFKADKNNLKITGENIANEQQLLIECSNKNNISPAEQHSMESNKEEGNESSSTNSSKNQNRKDFLGVNRISNNSGTGTSKLVRENTPQSSISPAFDLFCFIPKSLTMAQTSYENSTGKSPFGFKQCNFIDDPNLELAKKILNRSHERLVQLYDYVDLKSYLQSLHIKIDRILESENRTGTINIENSPYPVPSQFLPRNVTDIKKFLVQCTLKASEEQEIATLKNEISQYISLHCKSEMRKCFGKEQFDSGVNLSALPSISVDGIRISYKIVENSETRKTSDELLNQVPSKILNVLDQSDVLSPSNCFKLTNTYLNETNTSVSSQNSIFVGDIELNTSPVSNHSHSEKYDEDEAAEKICVDIKDYFNHYKSIMTQNTYKSFSNQYFENIISSLKASGNENYKICDEIEVGIKDYFNHCKSSMTQDKYESFSSKYFENIIDSLNKHRKSMETINVPQEYRNQQVYSVVEENDPPQEENRPNEERAESIDDHTASVERGSIASQIVTSVVDNVATEDQASETHVKLEDNGQDLCSLECHWSVTMKYRIRNYRYGVENTGECSEPTRMKYPLASDSRGKDNSSEILNSEEEKLGRLKSLLYEFLNKIKHDERMGDIKALLKSLIGYGHPQSTDDDDDESSVVTDDEAARNITKSNEKPVGEKSCCDVCPIYCPCCIYNKNNPASEVFVKNLQNDLKSKLDSLLDENKDSSSSVGSRNVDSIAENSPRNSSEEEIIQEFIMESADDLYKKHLLHNTDSPDHEKEELEKSESQNINYSDLSASRNKQLEEIIANENDLDQSDGEILNSSLDNINKDHYSNTSKDKNLSNYMSSEGSDVQNHLDNSTAHHNMDSTDEHNQEENKLEAPEKLNYSRDEIASTMIKTSSSENDRISNHDQEVVEKIEEQELKEDGKKSLSKNDERNHKEDGNKSTRKTEEPPGEVANSSEKNGFKEDIGSADQYDQHFEKQNDNKINEKEEDSSPVASEKLIDHIGSKNDTNVIVESKNIPKDVKEDTKKEVEVNDVNENSKNEGEIPSKGFSTEIDKFKKKPSNRINSGGGEPSCRHERNCPHRRMKNLPDLDQPCENDGDFEPPSVISLLSSLNILKNKVIVKDQIIQCLADQLIQMAQKGCLWKNDMLECISSHPSKRYVDFDCAMVADYLAGFVYEKPNNQPCVYTDLPDHPLNLIIEDFISFDAVKISWQPPPGCARSGFDVYVNDELVERIRDPDGLATIVSNLDTKFVNSITVVMLDLDGMHCLLDKICISAVNSKKQNRISNYYQSLESEDENSSSSSVEEEVPNNNVMESGSLKFRFLKRKKKRL